MLRLESVKVGQVVSVANSGGWTTRSEGLYTVVKANKLRVEVCRNTDAYKRTFSVKRGVELCGAGYKNHRVYLETPESAAARDARTKLEQERKNAWAVVESATARRNYAAVQEAMDALSRVLEKFEG